MTKFIYLMGNIYNMSMVEKIISYNDNKIDKVLFTLKNGRDFEYQGRGALYLKNCIDIFMIDNGFVLDVHQVLRAGEDIYDCFEEKEKT